MDGLKINLDEILELKVEIIGVFDFRASSFVELSGKS